MKKFLKSREGFTLIELLVVIAIIGILAAVVVLAINPVAMMQKGRDANRKSDLATLSKAIDIDIASQVSGGTVRATGGANNTNTSRSTAWGGVIDDCCGSGDNLTCADAERINATTSGWLIDFDATCTTDRRDLSTYIGKIPVDPSSTAAFYYSYDTNADGTKYCLEADMEHVDSGANYKIGSDLSGCAIF